MLFDRFSIGTLRLANRLVRSAVCEGMASPDGAPSPELVDYDVRLVKGGVGLLIAGVTSPAPTGCILPRQCVIDRDELVPEFRKLTGAVHAAGGRIALQIGHGGSRSVAPGKGVKPAEWTVAELDGLVERMADAARRARDAGFDAVQLHGAHGYLLSEFLSPRFNARTDAYGGCLENRARLLFRTFAAVRRAVGGDFPVLLKINSCDFTENGFSEEECAAVLRRLAAHGLSAIEISGGVPESGPRRSPVRMGKCAAPYYEDFAARLRPELAIPVCLTGGIRDLATAERLVRTRVCDLVSLGRPLIADPELPAKWRDGAATGSCCTGCNRCFKPISEGLGVRCAKTAGEGK